jgi:hypothetical protein
MAAPVIGNALLYLKKTGVSVNISLIKFFLILSVSALILCWWGGGQLSAREGYNEPPRQLSYDQAGRLKINRDYFELSANTGGDFYFWAPGEFAASAGILQVPVTSDPILLEYGNGDQFVKSCKIPVDSGIGLLSVFVGAQRKDMVVLHRPDGRTTSANPAFVTEQKFRHMTIITVENPEPGMWKLETSGAGSYVVSARYSYGKRRQDSGAGEGIDLLSVQFVETGGRPGHEGLFPVKGMVRSGESRLCSISITGSISDPAAEFISQDNKVLGRIKLKPFSRESGGELLGTCTIPSTPFRIRVSGRDADGYPFQRVTAAIYVPEASHNDVLE